MEINKKDTSLWVMCAQISKVPIVSIVHTVSPLRCEYSYRHLTCTISTWQMFALTFSDGDASIGAERKAG